jgi:FkbH-like protein
LAADPFNPSRSTFNASQLRGEIEALLDQGDRPGALSTAKRYWSMSPDASAAQFLLKRSRDLLAPEHILEQRVAWVRSFTLEPVAPLLQAEALLAGCIVEPWVGDFNAYGQEILDPGSALYRFGPDTVIFAVDAAQIAPKLWMDFAGLPEEAILAEIDAAAATLASLIQALRRNTPANLIVHGLARPAWLAEGLLDAQRTVGQGEAFHRINGKLREVCVGQPNTVFLDYDELQAQHGRRQWRSETKWATVRLPLEVNAMPWLAAAWWRHLCPLVRSPAKVLVLDLDNTLWGGVVGEDGPDGLVLGDEHPGVFYKDFQRVIGAIAKRGILLAVASKNNQNDAMEVLASHPHMLLRPDAWSAMRINWASKVDNLISIAEELNVGLDSLVFVDDNPSECDAVRRALPMVEVVELPSKPVQFAETLLKVPRLERISLTEEDRKRGEYYADEQNRRQALSGAESLEAFLTSLEIKAEISALGDQDLARAAQLTQKTNQFNLTTRRYTEAELAERLTRPGWRGYVVRARDRFGDNGVVGLALTVAEGGRCEIDTLLLSCRVIGRGIEFALLSAVASDARRGGAETLTGRFIPSRKNQPAARVYADAGFQEAGQTDDGQLWNLSSPIAVATPAWVAIVGELET